MLDASASVPSAEWDRQVEAHAEALEHPTVQSAMRATGPVYVRVGQFSDTVEAITPWRLITADEGAFALAREVRAAARMSPGGTALGRAIATAHNWLDGRRECERHVIDVLTDGEADEAEAEAARDAAALDAVQVNALGVEAYGYAGDPVQWLRAHVVTPDGFAVFARDWRDVGGALRAKMVREIAGAGLQHYGYSVGSWTAGGGS
jgi:hypothetical protein